MKKKKKNEPKPGKGTTPERGDEVRLNRYIAMAGVCSRREADDLIVAGNIKVNGEVVKVPGTKIKFLVDKVELNKKELKPQRFVYFLMNKPKNYLTTTRDDRGRRTVMDLLRHVTNERVFPVGRLDRNTTGLLMFTNDGELADKLTHPSNHISKLYHVKLDKAFGETDMEKLSEGIELEDGFIKADKIGYAGEGRQDEVGIEIHSGRNRIVRRMFEALGYQVTGLDRVMFGSLTKKNLPRGRVRPLTLKEINFLKMH